MKTKYCLLITVLMFVTISAEAFSKKITIYAKIPCTIKTSTIEYNREASNNIRLKVASNSDNDILVTYSGWQKRIPLKSNNEYEATIISGDSDSILRKNRHMDISVIP
ncbi:hypothetical protein [Shewanella khirikhana]|uniref:Uncharacterized protein n=1 Tax=Shewanella khirikhana TaxID=1965282 RepID=A0ABM7DPE8_9GAMM|nr:hypothetical protein [Shewanella khirikhana]AZQ11545.1 hypothetical protein STH12_02467 [Shewanella khirikhana]